VARLPFCVPGDDDDPIDKYDDPAPLLEEIAQCAVDGIPMRYQLAIWFDRVWREGRLHVQVPTGSPPAMSSDRQVEAMMRVRDLMSDDPGPERGKAARAIKVVQAELQLGVTDKAIHGWMRQWQKQIDKDSREQEENYKEEIFTRLHALLREGKTVDESARQAFEQVPGRLANIGIVRQWAASLSVKPVVRKRKTRKVS
jgi:hypothetical protein